MIVNLTVTHQHRLLIDEWLHTSISEIINRKSVKVHTAFTHRTCSVIIGTSVSK